MMCMRSFFVLFSTLIQFASIVDAQSSNCPTTEVISTASDGSTWLICPGTTDKAATTRTISWIGSSAACRDICQATSGCKRAVYDTTFRYCLLKGSAAPTFVRSSRYQSIRFRAGPVVPVAPSAAPSAPVPQSSARTSTNGPVASSVTSPDGSCGGDQRFSCDGFAAGSCCSSYGWCGSSETHCGAGCQKLFGQCGPEAIDSARQSGAQATKSIISIATSPTSNPPTSADGSCGPASGSNCLGFSGGECCSSYGWCGSSPVHCGDGCQAGFGKCDAIPSVVSPPVASASSTPDVVSPCACGYRTDDSAVYTEALLSDFVSKTTNLNALAADWLVQEYRSESGANAPYNKQRSSKNTVFGNQGLQMFVRAVNGRDVGTSEMRTVRNDMKYGSFRVNMKYTDVVGTCGAFFFYQSNTAEIDVELLSKDPWYAQLVLHSGQNLPSSEIYDRRYLGFQPQSGFNDYRFDWKPNSVTFSFNNQAVRTMTKGVPQVGGGIYFNHWSDGSGWTGGPPNKDSAMILKNVRLYFNSSDPTVAQAATNRCQAARLQGKGEVCDVRRT